MRSRGTKNGQVMDEPRYSFEFRKDADHGVSLCPEHKREVPIHILYSRVFGFNNRFFAITGHLWILFFDINHPEVVEDRPVVLEFSNSRLKAVKFKELCPRNMTPRPFNLCPENTPRFPNLCSFSKQIILKYVVNLTPTACPFSGNTIHRIAGKYQPKCPARVDREASSWSRSHTHRRRSHYFVM